MAGPVREREETPYADLDPAGHYNRPDVFQLLVDTRHRSAAHEARLGVATD